MAREPSSIDRRTLLTWTLASGLAAGAGPVFATPSRTAATDIDALARWIIATPRERVLARAMREIRSGVLLADLRAATIVAAAREIRPNIASFNHAALVVTALGQLSEGPQQERELPLVLWGIDNFKAAQERDTFDDWKLPEPAAKLPPAAAARAELIAALERWDPPAADAALIALARSAPLSSVFEIVWEYGMRSRGNLGHRAIYAMVARRALPIVGERWTEDVLRSCVASFLGNTAEGPSPIFEKSREIVARGFTHRAGAAPSDAGVQREVLALLRGPEALDVPQALAEIAGGAASRTAIWDALVMMAAEVAVEAPGIGPLHAFTSTNALHYIASHAPNQRLADIALLQAGAWLCEFRASARHDHEGDEGLHIEALAATRFEVAEERSAERVARLLGEPGENRRNAAARAFGAAATDEGAGALARDMLVVVRDAGDEVHDFKLAAAVLEEMSCTGSDARRCALAALAVNLPDPRRAAPERHSRIADEIAIGR